MLAGSVNPLTHENFRGFCSRKRRGLSFTKAGKALVAKVFRNLLRGILEIFSAVKAVGIP